MPAPICCPFKKIGRCMQNLKASYYFNLEKFRHAKLFKADDFVWQALGQISTYLASLTLGDINIEIHKYAYLIDAHLISIGKGSIVDPGVYIKGPCVIGENCHIRHGAYIRGNLICGDHCVIGHDTEIKNSILLDHACAAHFAYLGDSILGNHVNLGAGTKCANLKLDHGQIYIHVEGQRIQTGLRKFGAIIGDCSQTGCNTVTNPGTLMGQNVLCYPVINVGGFVPSNSLVKSQSPITITPRDHQ